MVWNNETISQLRELWAQGLSTAEIGRRLGVTKNAIVGKAHRLDLDARPSPIRRDARAVDGSGAQNRAAGPTLPPLPSAQDAVPLNPSLNPSRPRACPTASSAAQGLRIVPVAPRPAAALSMLPGPVPCPQPPAASLPAPSLPPRPAALASRARLACCWPLGEPGSRTFRFCDESALPGKPYCGEHVKVAYVRVKDRKEDAA